MVELAGLLLLIYKQEGAHLPELPLLLAVSLEVIFSSTDWLLSRRDVTAMLAAMAVEAGRQGPGHKQQRQCLRIKIVMSTLTMVSAVEGQHRLGGTA